MNRWKLLKMLEEKCGGLEGFCSPLYYLKQIMYSQYSFASHLKSVGGNTFSFPYELPV